jgi:hypothetical protein
MFGFVFARPPDAEASSCFLVLFHPAGDTSIITGDKVLEELSFSETNGGSGSPRPIFSNWLPERSGGVNAITSGTQGK